MKKANLLAVLGALLAAMLVSACPSAPATPSPAPAATTAATAAAAVAPTASPTTAATATAQATTAPTAVPATAVRATPAATAAAAGATSRAPLKFDMVITPPGEAEQAMKMASEGGKGRMELTADGQRVILLTDTDAGTAYMWLPDENQALKVPFDQANDQLGVAVDSASLAQEARKGTQVGTETVNGQQADIYEFTDEDGTTRTWVSRADGLPLKSETQTPEGIVKVEFRNYDKADIPDADFTLPANVTVLDMGALPNIPTPGR
jgi:outer membrane lipoprotein-sorting protein